MKKILLLGDSIRLGYDRYVEMAFEGCAEVYYPKENCRYITNLIRGLPEWAKECGAEVDCVHWNAGLWDVRYLEDGERLTPIEAYGICIDRACRMIRAFFPKAKVVFATSTAVDEGAFGDFIKRYNADIEAYNAVAAEVVARHGFGVNDLYAVTRPLGAEYHSDATHYYTVGGTKLLTEAVVRVLEEQTGLCAKKLDYENVFHWEA